METSAAIEDARTLRLADGRLVRLAGLEPFSLLSADRIQAETALQEEAERLVSGQSITVQFVSDKPDRYGRLLAWVGLPDGTDLQSRLAGQGLAIVFPTGDTLACTRLLLKAEAEARLAKRGYWGEIPIRAATPQSLEPRIGLFAIFEGVVRSVGNRRTRTYLNFGERWDEDATGLISKADRAAFGGEAGLAAMAGKRVRIRGYVEERGGPMVALTSPLQLEILSEHALEE